MENEKRDCRSAAPEYSEPWRPQYHYSAKQSWVNDPNGLVYFKGVYHLYYQCIPDTNDNKSGDMHWGHATSTDLIHWKERPVVLFPDAVGKMWSGTGAVDHLNSSGFFGDTEDGTGIIIAYSTDTQHIGVAYSKDGYGFVKLSKTEPVVAHPEGVTEFRDPHIFRYPEENKWKMLVAGGYFRMFESDDAAVWSACADAQEEYRTECPNLIWMKVCGSDEEKWVLSLGGREYVVGSFDGKRFIGETERIDMNEGPDTYAGITFSDVPDGRVIMISWFNRWSYAMPPEGKWNGCFTLPVEMKLIRTDDSYRLIQTPVKEAESLFGETLFSAENIVCTRDNDPLRGILSNTFALEMTVDVEKSSGFSLGICVGDGDGAYMRFDADGECVFDRSESRTGIPALREKFNPRRFRIDQRSVKNGKLRLTVFVDRSNTEMFINGGYHYFTARIQPQPSSRGIRVIPDGTLYIDRLTVKEMRSIWDGERSGRTL